MAAQRFENAERWLHWIVILVSLGLALWPAFTAFSVHFDSTKVHIGFETIAGVSIGLAYWLVRGWSAALLWCVTSAHVGPITPNAIALPPDTEFGNVEPDRISDLAAYVDTHFPTGLVSQLPRDTRRQMYERWYEDNHNFARLVLRTHSGRRKKTITGCSILLPISLDAFSTYRNGLGTPDGWTQQDRTASTECTVLFMPVFHCQKTLKSSQAGAILAELFCSFAATHVSDVSKTIIVAPVMTEATRRNMRALGFEMFRHSRVGFELWELDGRRRKELSEAARGTFAAIESRKRAVKSKPPASRSGRAG